MDKNKIIEIATYIVVGLAIWVVSPLMGKFIDTFYFNYPKILTDAPLFMVGGLLLILLGCCLTGWTIWLFKIKGQGTPNPKLPPKTLIISGPYKFSRNPMAFGGFLTLLGEGLVYYSPSLGVIALAFAVIIYLNAMLVEEPELRRRFGAPYEEYLQQAPRFLPNPFKFYKK
jgi:protein-S-isoprenylcysteine O-methyltransferase Ste14